MMTYWPSPAKLNLFLYITGRRNDGYHTLQTLFQFLDYGDSIFIKARNDGQLNFLTPVIGIENKDNLIIRAAHLLIREAKRTHRLSKESGADIYVKKYLPIGSGLGGGSSNAATTLVALNYIWKCGFTENELVEFGQTLGADVSLFIRGHAAFAEGIGELLSPVQLKEKWYLIVYPGVSISTALIFKDPELPRNTKKRTMETLLKCKFKNDCEIIVRKRFHKVDVVLSWLLEYAPFRLTGTGSCIFSEFETKSDAYQLLKLISKHTCSFIARGANFSPLKRIVLKN